MTVKNSQEYQIWKGMRRRCLEKNHHAYKYYGGRGITVCARWRASFADFVSDMGERPSPQHQIDRIDNDGDYEPGNCRWALKSENLRNRRKIFKTELTFRKNSETHGDLLVVAEAKYQAALVAYKDFIAAAIADCGGVRVLSKKAGIVNSTIYEAMRKGGADGLRRLSNKIGPLVDKL